MELIAEQDGCITARWDLAPVVDVLCDLGFSAAELDGVLPAALTQAIGLRLGGALALEQVVEVERLDLGTGQAACALRTGAGQLLRPCLTVVGPDPAITELWWRAHRDAALYLAVAPMAEGATAVPHRCGELSEARRGVLDEMLVAIELGATLRVEARAVEAGAGTVGT